MDPFWDSPTWIEDHADIDKEYVDESLILKGKEDELFNRALEMNSYESKLPLSNKFPLEGEYCIYLLHNLVCLRKEKPT